MKDLKELASEALDILYDIEDLEGYKNNPVGKAINYLQEKDNITCACGNTFRGWKDKEDTCQSCLKKLLNNK